MNWEKARTLLRLARTQPLLEPTTGPFVPVLPDGDGAEVSPGADAQPALRGRLAAPREAAGADADRASSICVASGKGGTGKSILTASLASLLSARGRTLIVDADLGVGDAHILQDVSPEHTFVDVVERGVPVRAAVERCRGQVDLLAAGSGVSHMAGLSTGELHVIASGLEDLERDYRYLVVDSAAGVSGQTLSIAAACDVVLLLTTPVLTAMTDAYAFLKVLLTTSPDALVLVVVNRAQDEDEARRVAERIAGVAARFLGRSPRLLGWLPEDPAVKRSSNRRAPVTHAEPDAEVSRALRRLAVRLVEEVSRVRPRGLGARLVRGLSLVD